MLLRSNFSSFPQYFRYISNVKSPITYKFVKCGCSNYFFLNSENLICRGKDISKCFRGSLGIRDNKSRLYLLLKWPPEPDHNKYCANSVDTDGPSHQDLHCLPFCYWPLIETPNITMNVSQFRDGKVHVRNIRMKGLIRKVSFQDGRFRSI